MAFQLNLQTEPIGRISALTPVCIPCGSSVSDAIEAMKAHAAGSVLVCEDQKLAGILTERDVLKLMSEASDFEAPVDDFMTRDPVTLSKDDSVGHRSR